MKQMYSIRTISKLIEFPYEIIHFFIVLVTRNRQLCDWELKKKQLIIITHEPSAHTAVLIFAIVQC